MVIPVYYDEKKKQILIKFEGKEHNLGLFYLGLGLAKPDQVKEKLGDKRPVLDIICEADEKIYNAVKDVDKLLDEIYYS